MLLISASKSRKISVSSKPIAPGLHCQFQVSQGCRVRPCLKTTKPNKKPMENLSNRTDQGEDRIFDLEDICRKKNNPIRTF